MSGEEKGERALYILGFSISILTFLPLLYIIVLRHFNIYVIAVTLTIFIILAIYLSMKETTIEERKGFKKGFEVLPKLVSNTITSLLLIIVYLLVIGIIYIISKIAMKRFLDTRLSDEKDTYWEDCSSEMSNMDPHRMF